MAVSFVVTVIRRLFSRIQNSIQTLCHLSIFYNYNSVFATVVDCVFFFCTKPGNYLHLKRLKRLCLIRPCIVIYAVGIEKRNERDGNNSTSPRLWTKHGLGHGLPVVDFLELVSALL